MNDSVKKKIKARALNAAEAAVHVTNGVTMFGPFFVTLGVWAVSDLSDFCSRRLRQK